MNRHSSDHGRLPFPERLKPIILSEAENEAFRAGCQELAGRYPALDLDDNRVLAAMVVGGGCVPTRLVEALTLFRWTSSDHGGLVIRGIPVDTTLPATPSGGRPPSPVELPISTVAQLTVLGLLGDLIGYASEKGGALIQDIVAQPGMEARQENVGSALLELHTENGFHPARPDFVTLLCLRPDRNGNSQTVVASLSGALPALSPGVVNRLQKPEFRIAYSSSFVGTGRSLYSEPLAVITETAGTTTMVADLHAMEAMTDEGKAALAELFEALQRTAVGVRLLPGDLLVIDNRTSVHGRTPFVPRFDGRDRWLRRAFAITDLRRCEAGRPPYSRVVSP